MLQQVAIQNPKGQVLNLPFWDNSNGYSVQGIDGLEPVKASIVTSSFVSMDGEQYQASRREKRNILATIGMDSGHISKSVRDLRFDLYNFFMPKMQITLRFLDSDGMVYKIDGRVESFEAPLFSKEPQATISLLCFDPDFLAPNPTTLLAGSVVIETDDDGNAVFVGEDFEFTYPGTSPTGVYMEFPLTESLDEFTIQQRLPDGNYQTIDLVYDFLAGDILKVTTVPGSKKIILNRAGLETSILYAMSYTSQWLTLQPGVNSFRVAARGDSIPYTITYTARFGGL